MSARAVRERDAVKQWPKYMRHGWRKGLAVYRSGYRGRGAVVDVLVRWGGTAELRRFAALEAIRDAATVELRAGLGLGVPQ